MIVCVFVRVPFFYVYISERINSLTLLQYCLHYTRGD
jgi:hypothetical protein